MWEFLRRLWSAEAAREYAEREAAVVAGTLGINTAPDSKQAILRHLTRVVACRKALIEDAPNAQEFRDELRVRTAKLMLQGIDLPATIAEVQAMIEEVK